MVCGPGRLDPARLGDSASNAERGILLHVSFHLYSRASIDLSELK